MLNAFVKLRRHNISGMVSFLVDTGADLTTLMPKDAFRLGINYSLLRNPDQAEGVGGSAKCYQEAAVISLFDEDDEQREHNVILDILEPDPRRPTMRLPSLLGRDIINDYRMIFDAHGSRLHFDLG